MMKVFQDGNVYFAHKAGASPKNIGDILCSPCLYFDVRSKNQPILIVGGGSIPNAENINVPGKFHARITWAVGTSTSLLPPETNNRTLLSARKLLNLFYTKRKKHREITASGAEKIILSTRDRNAVIDNTHLVACPSCFHPVLRRARGKRIGVVLNANVKVSGNIEQLYNAIRNLFPEIIFATNAMDEQQLESFLSETETIITNSYHFTYWSLLSGGSVAPIACSDKIYSVINLLNQSGDTIRNYKKGDDVTLKEAIIDALNAKDWIRLSDPELTRDGLQETNIRFCKTISEILPEVKITQRTDR